MLAAPQYCMRNRNLHLLRFRVTATLGLDQIFADGVSYQRRLTSEA